MFDNGVTDEDSLAKYIDHERWLMNKGVVSEQTKNQLFFCGSIVHKEVMAVELDIAVQPKKVNYVIYVDSPLLEKYNKYKELSTRKDLIGMWLFRRMLKKEGNLNFNGILNKFIKDYCGPKWSAEVEVKETSSYTGGVESGNQDDGWAINQLFDPK